MTSTTTDRRQGINAGAAVKVPVKAATTANLTLSGEQTIDGVSCVTGDRVLVKDQTSSVNNGIYTVDTSTWSRTPDFDGAFDVVQATLVFVINGSTNTGWWYVSTVDPITLGATAITFARTSSTLAVISSFIQTLLDDTSASIAQTTLGISAFIQTLLDDVDAATARTTLGAVGLTGNESIAGNKTLSGSTTLSGTATLQALLDISGASAGQIKFPANQNASANANTLDDYEEGTWTPSLGGSATYTSRTGVYIKIGRMVFIRCYFTVNTIGTGSDNQVSGLPFTSSNDGDGFFVAGGGFAAFDTAAHNLACATPAIESNATTLRIRVILAAGGASLGHGGASGFFGNSTNAVFSVAYHTP